MTVTALIRAMVRAAWVSAALALLPAGAQAQAAGQAVEVDAPAQITTAGVARRLSQGDPVQVGDIIQTGAAGRVQVVFIDETKMVVGPGSTLRIDEALFRSNGTARRLATSALGGTFRFISGKSPKQVYRLATPVATMGIRGTVFDYSVTANEGTDLLVFNGTVRFCARGRLCATVPGGCQAVTARRDGTFGQPADTGEKETLLASRFPLVAAQADLLPPFRASTAGCDSVSPIRLPTRVDRANQNDRSPAGNDRGNPADGPSGPSGGGGNPAD